MTRGHRPTRYPCSSYRWPAAISGRSQDYADHHAADAFFIALVIHIGKIRNV